MQNNSMFSREITVNNQLGLHARPAARIAKLAQTAKCKVWLVKGRETVDAASIIDILSIACARGSRLKIAIEDQADIKILDAIAELVENGLSD
jgi:phosphocarrier protein